MVAITSTCRLEEVRLKIGEATNIGERMPPIRSDAEAIASQALRRTDFSVGVQSREAGPSAKGSSMHFVIKACSIAASVVSGNR